MLDTRPRSTGLTPEMKSTGITEVASRDFRLDGRDKPNQILVAIGYSLLNGNQQLPRPCQIRHAHPWSRRPGRPRVPIRAFDCSGGKLTKPKAILRFARDIG